MESYYPKKPNWTNSLAQQALLEARRRINDKNNTSKFHKYQLSPVSFCTDVLKASLTKDMISIFDSVANNIVTIVKSANAVGKCLESNQSLFLSTGEYVKANDLIGKKFRIASFDEKLNVSFQDAYASYNGQFDVVEIITDLRRITRVTLNHPLVSADSSFSSGKTPKIDNIHWVNAGDVKVGDVLLTSTKWFVENCVNYYSDDELKFLAYAIADGYLVGQISIKNNNPVIIQELGEISHNLGLIKRSSNGNHRFVRDKNGVNLALNLIKYAGLYDKLSAQKFVPKEIFSMSDDKIAIFLSRMFSTDGWVSVSETTGRWHKNDRSLLTQVGYSSMSERLVDDIRILLLRLGIVSIARSRLSTWTVNGVKKQDVSFCVEIHDKKSLLAFADRVGIFSKQDRLDELVGVVNNKSKESKFRDKDLPDYCHWEKVKQVNFLGKKDTVAIYVPNNNTYIDDFYNHNTFCAAHLAVWFYKCHEGAQVYTTAAPPLDNLKRILWGELSKLTENNKDVFSGDKLTRFNISRSDSSFIVGVSIPTSGSAEQREAKFSGKHAPNLLFIVDEGDAVPNEIYKGIESCMSGGNAKLLVLFNPRMQSGKLYQMEMESTASIINASAFNHPNVVSGKNLINGAVTRDITVRRINEWTRPLMDSENIDSECFAVPNYLTGSIATAQDGSLYPPLDQGYRKILTSEFSYMVLGEYPSQSDTQLINDEWIIKARRRWDEYVENNGENMVNPVMGLDIAEYGKDYNVACLRSENFVGRFVMWTGLDVIRSGDRASVIYKDKNVSTVIVDATGVGSGVAPYMSRLLTGDNRIKAVSVKVSSKPHFGYVKSELGDFYQLRDQLWWAVREWLRIEEAMLPPDEFLIQELKTPTYRVINGKIKIMDKDTIRDILRRSSDRADALCLTFSPQRRAKVLLLEN